MRKSENITKTSAKFEKIGKTYGFFIKGSKARIDFKYYRPSRLVQEGSSSILVAGWVTDESKKKHKFSGSLVKIFGSDFKDNSKDLTESLEKADVASSNPIANAYGSVYDFVQEIFIKNVPFDAMENFFAGIREKKAPVKKEPKTKEAPKQDKVLTKWPTKTPVIINIDSMMQKDDALFLAIKDKYPDLENSPHGVVYDDAGDKTTVVFPNKEYYIIPKQYLKMGNSADFVSDEEKTSKNALTHYEDLKQHGLTNPEVFQHMDVNLAKSMIDYKLRKNLPLDEIDKKFQSGELPKKENWIKNLFNKRK